MPTQNLPGQIANQLRRKILVGDLAPGSSVKERDTAADLGVSRTPMREAIRLLAQEGLLVLRPARSPIVANPTLTEVSNNIDVMKALELLSAELAVERATEAELVEVSHLCDQMIELSGADHSLDFFEVDMAFHSAVAAASHNPALLETHTAYVARLWRARYLSATRPEGRPQLIGQHVAICEALKARDLERVLHETNDHVERMRRNISGMFSDRDEAAE